MYATKLVVAETGRNWQMNNLLKKIKCATVSDISV